MTTSWSATPPSGSPQDYPHSPTDAVNGLLDMIERYRTQLDEMRNNLLSTAGISVTPQGLVADKSMIVNGTLGVTGSTDIDGTLNVDANATFGGTMVVTGNATFSGDLAVPNGSIKNAALASPIAAATLSNAAAGFSLGPGYGGYAAVTFTVPTGFTKVDVQATGSAAMYYTGATNPETLFARMTVGSSNGPEFQHLVDTSSVGARICSTAVGHSATFTGLGAGAPITVYLGLHSNAAAWPGNGYNFASVSAMAIFTRT